MGTLVCLESYRDQVGGTPNRPAAIVDEAADVAEPIHVLNLVRFHATAQYEQGDEPVAGRTLSGREAYLTFASYLAALMPEFGATPVMSSSSNRIVDGPTGEKWDMMIIIRFPSRAVFMEMVESSMYRRIEHHRTAALCDSRVIITEAHR